MARRCQQCGGQFTAPAHLRNIPRLQVSIPITLPYQYRGRADTTAVSYSLRLAVPYHTPTAVALTRRFRPTLSRDRKQHTRELRSTTRRGILETICQYPLLRVPR